MAQLGFELNVCRVLALNDSIIWYNSTLLEANYVSHGSSFNSHKRPMSALTLLFYFAEKKTEAQKEIPWGLRYGDLVSSSCVWRAVSRQLTLQNTCHSQDTSFSLGSSALSSALTFQAMWAESHEEKIPLTLTDGFLKFLSDSPWTWTSREGLTKAKTSRYVTSLLGRFF